MYCSQPSLTILIITTIFNSLTPSTWIAHTSLLLKLFTPFSSILLLTCHRTWKLLSGPGFLVWTHPPLIFFFFFCHPSLSSYNQSIIIKSTLNAFCIHLPCWSSDPLLLSGTKKLELIKHASCVQRCGRRWLPHKVYSSLSFRKEILILSWAHNCSAKGKT